MSILLMRMPVHKSWRTVIGAALVLNLLMVGYLAVQQHRHLEVGRGSSGHQTLTSPSHSELTVNKSYETLASSVTVILRDYENFDNAIVETVRQLQTVLKGCTIFVIGDTLVYPPLKLDKTWNTDIISLQANLLLNYSSSRPVHLIKTKYVLLLPDGTSFKLRKHLQAAVNLLDGKGKTKAVAVGVGSEPLQCSSLNIDLKRWQMTVAAQSTSSDYCDLLTGDHALLMRTSDFRSLAEPFARPVSPCFYVQAKLREWKVWYMKQFQLMRIKKLFTEPHNKWKHNLGDKERVSDFYKQSGIKLVVHSNGLHDYYGCTKRTARCFSTIVDDMPEYLYQGRWTPPCCLKALRETAKHVFGILDQENVRYWLEGGSLLGAARNQDIIPWDYDVDIGIYKDDIDKSSYLKDALDSSFIDEQGFVWEKAPDGDFIRVQYSEQNHLHVDIHPFFSKNGTMTKNTWFLTHRQDKEFPEHFLKPLTKINFAGIVANAPNNIEQFLEFKFGVGVITQPRFPNLQQAQ